MPLLQFEDEIINEKATRVALGIDLGTTHSLVAVRQNQHIDVLEDCEGEFLLPSVVHYSENVLIGYPTKEYLSCDPSNTIASVKRFMGRSLDEIVAQCGKNLPYNFVQADRGMPKIRTSYGIVSPVQVSAEILKVLKQQAERQLQEVVQDAVITVPAYFDDAQRQATKDSAKLAGLNVLRLLNEPTAAAIAYGLDKALEGIYVVYDFGGGTFDVSILHFSQGIFEVIAIGGDSALGGDDMDRAIAEKIIQDAAIQNVDASLMRIILHEACRAKEILSSSQEVVIKIDLPSRGFWETTFTREQLNQCIATLVEKTLKACRLTLQDAHLKASEVNDVILVGGTTRIPFVREQVAQLFQKDPLTDIDPEKVVAMGAAIQADILVGNRTEQDVLLLDVLPLSLGIETMGGLVEKIIMRNTKIPVQASQVFTTFKDGQTAIAIHVLQGERELVQDCRSLARFELRDIPPLPAGQAKVEVTFQVDLDGLLAVSAKELTSEKSAHIQVKPTYGLGDQEIEKMLLDSFEHAEDDFDARMLAELKVEGLRLAEAVDAALKQDGHALLSDEELVVLEEKLHDLQSACTTDDPEYVQNALWNLDRATRTFARSRMDAKIKTALQGKNIDDL